MPAGEDERLAPQVPPDTCPRVKDFLLFFRGSWETSMSSVSTLSFPQQWLRFTLRAGVNGAGSQLVFKVLISLK